mmetsp:Transcript_593/g.1239  ORF Transcript_593/g.1239 Transcript_593/m.1239 type:complete len:89 (+) Transcript_593:375-641(+)
MTRVRTTYCTKEDECVQAGKGDATRAGWRRLQMQLGVMAVADTSSGYIEIQPAHPAVAPHRILTGSESSTPSPPTIVHARLAAKYVVR